MIQSRINQRRAQVLVHSFLYYQMDASYIDDHKFDEWAKELAELQKKHPEIAEKCIFAEAFRSFTGSTGYDLPYDNEWVQAKALQLLEIQRSEK